MKPLICPIKDLTAFVEERRQKRSVTPAKKPMARTVLALSRAWGVSEPRILAALEKRFKLDIEKADLLVSNNKGDKK